MGPAGGSILRPPQVVGHLVTLLVDATAMNALLAHDEHDCCGGEKLSVAKPGKRFPLPPPQASPLPNTGWGVVADYGGGVKEDWSRSPPHLGTYTDAGGS